LNNMSSGYTPRFSEETVRQMFASSAAALLDDFHIDGLRVDLTDAIHQNNTLNANGASVPSANRYGIKFLRELARTVKLVNPKAFLIAEDHSGWAAMTQPADQGGEGFDAVWYADFYHHLIGDGNYGDNYAKLLKNAGYGTTAALNMDFFAGALLATPFDKVVYRENHDEAGNEANTERTIVTAVNRAPFDWSDAEVRGGTQPLCRRPGGAVGRHPDVFDGGRDRRREVFPLHRLLSEQGRSGRRADWRRKVPVPFLSGSDSPGDRQPGGAVPRTRCH